MSFTVEVFPDEPILLITMDKSFTIANDLTNFVMQITQVLDATQEPLFYVAIANDLRISFEDIVSAATTVTRGRDALLQHPNIRELLVVTSDRLLSLTVQGLRNPVFGLEKPISVYLSLEEAIAYAREQMISA